MDNEMIKFAVFVAPHARVGCKAIDEIDLEAYSVTTRFVLQQVANNVSNIIYCTSQEILDE